MKKLILVLCCIATLASCSNDDDFDNYYFETMPTESVDTPEEMVVNEVYQFTVNYIKPTSCYALYDLYYQDGEEDEIDDNNETIDKDFIRIIAPINAVYEDSDCEQLDELTDVTFDFSPRETGTFRFKFWTGTDENDEDTFLVVDIPVVEE